MNKNKKPNFLIIYPDTMGINDVGCYGNSIVKTPNIDKLAETGIKFEECTSQNPICVPSRTSLLSGKYVSTHGVQDNGVASYAKGHLTFARYLRDVGYTTAYYGKTHAVNQSEWDDVFDLYPDYKRYLKARGIDVTYPETPSSDEMNSGFSDIPSKDWATNVLGNLGASFIKQQKEEDKPFLLFMSFEAPHSPCTLPREDKELYDPESVRLPDPPENYLNSRCPEFKEYISKRASLTPSREKLKHAVAIYYALTQLMDRNVGKLIDVLEENGLRDDTIIIFMSDHGDFAGNHNCVGKTMCLEQALIHVPQIFNCPSRFKPAVVESLTEAIDIFPTLVELVDGTTVRGLQGMSLVPYLNSSKPLKERQFSFSEEHFGERVHQMSVRNRDYKFILSNTGYEELYRIKNDPLEWRNLINDSDKQDLVRELKDALLQWHFTCVDKTIVRKSDWIQEMLDDIGGPFG